MQIYPAIDLQAKQCVRLYKGEFNQATVYSGDPFSVAKQFIAAGVQWLHIIDLDAAKDPQKNQYDLINEIIANIPVNIQIGGGIRTRQQIENLFNVGVKRVIIGSQAIYKPDEVKHWFELFGSERIVLALDVKILTDNQAYICTQGWQQTTKFKLKTIIDTYLMHGLKHVLCTDISRDGTLQGPNINLYQKLLEQFPTIELQASGGIASLADLQQLRSNRLNGAVLGRALYENKFTLSEALTC